MKTGVLQFPSNHKLALKSLSTGLTEIEEVLKSPQARVSTEPEDEFDGVAFRDDSGEVLGDGVVIALNDEAERNYNDLMRSKF
jgi:hypothetical protein